MVASSNVFLYVADLWRFDISQPMLGIEPGILVTNAFY
ncbi:hypothetical protein O77CONTIG1_04740 [Leptolyngbya sp. O-77]|nr:hypothetical protein O77CONTIG1_04740 [Leptolyngbya sp. O-77]